MTKEETLKNIEIMQAWADGQAIEYRDITWTDSYDWRDLGDKPLWNFGFLEYRIKPVPKSSDLQKMLDKETYILNSFDKEVQDKLALFRLKEEATRKAVREEEEARIAHREAFRRYDDQKYIITKLIYQTNDAIIKESKS